MTTTIGVVSFEVLVPTPGVSVSLKNAQALSAYNVLIQAKDTNTGKIFVGGSDVSASKKFSLRPGSTLSLGDIQTKGGQIQLYLDMIYIDAAVAGEGIEVICDSPFLRNS